MSEAHAAVDLTMSAEDLRALLELKEEELQKLTIVNNEKDELLTMMQQTQGENSDRVTELMAETRALASRSEETYRAQLKEKGKQLEIMQALLDDAQRASARPTDVFGGAGGEPGKLDRGFMDDFLISVLEQKDQLADQLYTLNNAYADVKARLGMAEFEREKLQAEFRAAARKGGHGGSGSPGPSPGGSDQGEAHSALVAERDRLASTLADANRTVKELQARANDSSTGKDAERKRRKEAHRTGKSISKGSKLEGLESENKNLSIKLEAESMKLQNVLDELYAKNGGPDSSVRVQDLELENDSLKRKLETREMEFAGTMEELNLLKSLLGGDNSSLQTMELEGKLVDALKDVELARATVQSFERDLAATQEQLANLKQQLDTAGAREAGHQEAIATISALQDRLREEQTESTTIIDSQELAIKQLTSYKTMHEKLAIEVEERRAEVESAQGSHAQSEAEKLQAFKDRDRVHGLFLNEQRERRKLHNKLVELKGNIRVFAKIRPTLSHDHDAAGNEAVKAVDNVAVEAMVQGTPREFEYDFVFAPGLSPDRVFEEVSPLVTSFVDGFNVCVLAYGQTGSGKTFTMLGPSAIDGSPSMDGVIPKAMAQMFQLAQDQAAHATFEFHVTVLEVYNEYVRDLISEQPWEKHEVTEGSGQTGVPTARTVEVRSAEDVLNLVSHGMGARVERKTDLNEHSSRSHLIITAHLTRRSLLKDGETIACRMHLVDLAGSENAKLAGSGTHDIQGLHEGKAINRSLSSLSSVLMNLSKQTAGKSAAKQHVPYRNSKLTYLLKDAIGGNAKTVMVVCLPPGQTFLTESIQTLRFGSSARQIEKGAATKNVVGGAPKKKASTGPKKKAAS